MDILQLSKIPSAKTSLFNVCPSYKPPFHHFVPRFPSHVWFVEGIPMKHRSAKLSRLSPLPWALASCGAPAKSIPRKRPLNGEHHIWLVLLTILKNDGVRQWGWDDIPYMKWKS